MKATVGEHHLWADRFRPHKVADCILPDRLKANFQSIVDDGKLGNMTLVGGPGIGKTTVARALCEELELDHIIINASENGNIDTIRTTVRQFASSFSFDGKIKCIILDEADFLTMNAQAALRASIEEFSGNCRFIFTGNFGNRFTDAILSRAPLVDFAISKSERADLMLQFLKRAVKVLTDEGVTFDPDLLFKIVKTHFPDCRKLWNLLQRFSATGTLIESNRSVYSDEALMELVKLLKTKDFTNMRKWVVENLDNDTASLRRMLYAKSTQFVKSDSIPQLVLILAEYDFKEAQVMDKEINMVAMLTTIMIDVSFT